MTFFLKGYRNSEEVAIFEPPPLTQEIVYLSMTCRPIALHDKNKGVKTFDTFGQLSTGTQGWNAPPLRRQGQHGRLL